MKPEDDPTWWVCDEHGERHWCDMTARYYREGHDVASEVLKPGMEYMVPVYPTVSEYAMVSIPPTAVIEGVAWEIELQVDRGIDTEYINLGLWSPNEGRYSLSLVVLAWASMQEGEDCKNSAHGYAQQKAVGSVAPAINAWFLSYYGKCYGCSNLSNPIATGDNFGLGGMTVITNTGAASNPRGGRNAAARDALAARFNV